jgi:BirA family transcriptional regulator, biotin operon repressor / biotin---[acetyl-CoA-carboxylase] ligase
VAERRFFDSIPSTQAEAIRLARDGAPDGLRVVARRQTAGVGRADHRWASPDGGLYISVVLPGGSSGDGLVALGTGAFLRDGLEDAFGVRPVLKWPNDLLAAVDGRMRKLSGVLADRVDSRQGEPGLVVGIGVNVSTRVEELPDDVRGRATSLLQLMGHAPSLEQVESVAAKAAVSAVSVLGRPDGPAEVVGRARGALYGRGRTAVVDGVLRGVIETVGDGGELWLSTGAGRVSVRAGDLVVEEPA